MKTKHVRRLMAALSVGRHEARFVGGSVRNAIMKKPIKDIDIATSSR
jgi:poly(A) polymerase